MSLELKKEDILLFLEYYRAHKCNLTKAAASCAIKLRSNALLLAEKYPWVAEAMSLAYDEMWENIEEEALSGCAEDPKHALAVLTKHKEGKKRGWGHKVEHSGGVTVFSDLPEE